MPALPNPASNRLALRWSWLLPVAALVAVFHFSPIGTALDWAFFDAASRRPLRPTHLPADSAIVLVDDQTLAAMSAQGARWPFPRILFAQLIAALHQAGAKAVLVDFTFLEESSAAEQDALLAGVAAAAPSVILARTAEREPVFWTEAFRQQIPGSFQHPRTGLVDLNSGADGIARAYTPSRSLASAGDTVSGPGGLLRWHGGLETLRERGVPVLSAAPYILAGRAVVERLADAAPDLAPGDLARALAREAPLSGRLAEAVQGRTVFVGANASGTFDLKPTPVGQVEPGVLIHWTAWTNLRQGGFITRVPAWTVLALAALAMTAVMLAGQRHVSLTRPIVAASLLAAGGAFAAYALLGAGWFVPPATPVFALGLTLLGVVAESFWREQRRKREIQAMFGAYVDPAVVAQLVRNPAAIRLGGERREATVFFSDLAGFTDLSEKLRDQPERMVEIVNAYLEATSERLHRHGAYVDKYIGDAVMAVFGVPQPQPDHAHAACAAALEALRALDDVNRRYADAVGVRLEVRIGLNTGDMIVGNLGSARKRNYTVMGDAVNLASRLEGANKEFGTSILLGETTALRVQDRFATRPLTRLRVKGKQTAIEVHELVGAHADLAADARDFLRHYRDGYARYCARDFAGAAAAFAAARTLRPDDAMTLELLAQSERLRQQPPPDNWEPVLTLKSK